MYSGLWKMQVCASNNNESKDIYYLNGIINL